MNIQGSIPALITPFKNDQSIDFECLEKLIEWHIEQKSDGLVIAGTSGESATLNVEEQVKLIAVSVKIANKRLPIIAGTGANSTSEAIELTKLAYDSGANACLLVTPYYNKPEQEGLFLHFKAIADAVPIDQILYNVPGRTCCDLLPDTTAKLSKIKNIIGLKDATGRLERLADLKKVVDDNFILLSGDDGTACDFNLQGGHGGITVTGNVFPKLNHDLYQYACAGEAKKAKEIDARLQGLHKHLFCQANPIPVKWALSNLGFTENVFRLPLTPLDSKYHSLVLSAISQVKSI